MKRSKVIWCQGPKIYAFHNDYLKKAHKCTLSQDKAPTCPNKPHAVKKQPRKKVPVFHSFLNTPLGDWRGWPGDSLDDRKFLFPPLLDAVPFSASFPWSGSVDESKITAWWLHHRMQNTGVITLRHILNGQNTTLLFSLKHASQECAQYKLRGFGSCMVVQFRLPLSGAIFLQFSVTVQNFSQNFSVYFCLLATLTGIVCVCGVCGCVCGGGCGGGVPASRPAWT